VSLPEVFARLARESGERVRLAREQERIAGELRIAHEMQAKLLPQAPPQIPGLEVSGFSDPCREVGGDYFDYWALSGNRLAVCIGDVTGKGVPAALMMAMVKSCLFTMVKDDASPGLILRTLGSMVRSLGDRHQLMTFLFAVIDPVHKVARFANAGHLYPYLLRPSQGKPVFLEANGLPLGAPCQVEYAEAEYAIQPDDRLIFSTDGFVEAHNTAGGMMGFERVQDVLETTRLQDCDTTIQTVLRSVRQFTGLAEVEDDRTIVVVRLKDCGNASV
jgi:sigma-B regulation protein RsbU (phosphoserine phosphatase)